MLPWATLVALSMFFVLVMVYVRLARTEEADMLREFGAEYESYRQQVPAFVAHFSATIRLLYGCQNDLLQRALP